MKKILKSAFAVCSIVLAFVLCTGFVGVGTKTAKAAETLSDYAGVSVSSEYFTGAPTVVGVLNESSVLEQIKSNGAEQPENIVLTLDENANVISDDGDVIGSFKDVAQSVYGHSIIVVNLKTEAAKDAFVAACDEFAIKDLSIMSQNAEILHSARSSIKYARGIYDVSGVKYDFSGKNGRKTLTDVLKTANSSMANIVVLSEEQATRAVVEFFQFRFKTVWVAVDENGDSFDVQKIISSGAYGIVSENFGMVYSTYTGYGKGTENQKPLTRRPANIAHRGLPASMPENTVAGFVAAIDGGATHVETDVQLTKDNKLVLMHDNSISRTTDYATVGGNVHAISQLTYDELKKYSVVYGTQKEPIPLLEDAFKALKDKDVVLVLEIKQSHNDIVRLIREKIDEYDFWDKIVLISFYNEELAKAFDIIPEVPTASLNGIPVSEKSKSEYYNSINTVSDSTNSISYYTIDFCDGFLKNRGYLSYFWTYGNGYAAYNAAVDGVFGITNNGATDFAELGEFEIEGAKNQKVKEEKLVKDGEIAIKLKNYCGSKQRVGKIFSVKKGENSAEVIAYIESDDVVLYTEPFTVGYASETQSGGESSTTSSCSSYLGGTDVLACAVIVAAAIALRVKRRYDKKTN